MITDLLGFQLSGQVITISPPDSPANAAARIAVGHEAPLNVEWPEYSASPTASQSANTTAINAAIAALPSNGGQILLPRRYPTNGTITLDNRTNVQIAGLDGSANGASGIDYFGAGTAISARSATGCVLRNFGVADAASTAAVLVDMGTTGVATSAGSSNCLADGVFFHGVSGSAKLLRLAQATVIHVTGARFQGGAIAVQGIELTSGGFCNAILIDGECWFNAQTSVAIKSLGAGSVVSGNTFEPLTGGVAGAYLQDPAIPGRGLAWLGNWTGDSTSGSWIVYNGEALTVLGGLLDAAVDGIKLNGATDGLTVAGVWFASLTNAINLNSQAVTRISEGGNRYNSVTNVFGGATVNANGTAWGAGSLVSDGTGTHRTSDNLVVADGDPTRVRVGNKGGGAPIIYFGAAEDTAIYRNAASQLRTSQQFIASDGVTTKTKAGAPVDGDFAVTPGDGTLVADTTNSKMWVRLGGAWKGVVVA